MGDLFDVGPMGWGLRGDPYLWKEMKEHFASTCLPNSKSELESLVSNAFKELTGHQISENKFFYVKRFAHGGMSSGMVAPDYWKNKVIPYLWHSINNEDTMWLF